MAAILSAILVIGCQTKPVFAIKREIGGSNPYMKFGRNRIKKDLVRVTTDRLEQEIDGSNPYMKFGRNLIKND